jgi:hypothetical protein
LRRDRARDFDVEHDFAIVRIRGGRFVPGAIDRDCRHVGRCNADFVEEDLEIAGAKSASQFDDGNRLTGSIESLAAKCRWEVVALGEFRGGHAIAAAGTGSARPDVHIAMLGTRIKAKHARHNPIQRLWDLDFALPSSISAGGVVINLYIRRKQAQEIAKRSPQHNRTLRRAAMCDDEIVLLRELLHEVEVLRSGPMSLSQLRSRKISSLGKRLAALLLHALFERGDIADGTGANGESGDL